MRIVLIGPPGAGKGTQAAQLGPRLGVPHVSTGDLFRAHIANRTPLGREAQRYLDAGELVPDEITNDMVLDRLAEPDAGSGFLLDGFPRTTVQAGVLAVALAAHRLSLDAVLAFDLPDEVVTRRLLGRGRPDDTEEIIRHRLSAYRDQTAPLLDHYADLVITVDAHGTVDQITERALGGLSSTQRPTRA